MRPTASLATALAVLLPLACAAPAPSGPPAPAVAPASPPAAPAAAQAGEPAAPIVATPPAVEPVASPVDDCGLQAKIASKRGPDGQTQYTLTLKNAGTTARTLVTPGDGSEDGRRTPLLSWSGTRDGTSAPQLERPGCGMMNAIEASEIFTLEPGASKAMSTWILGPSYGPGRYEVQLRYINDPGKRESANVSREVAALLETTSACDVTSAPLAIVVP